MEFDLQPTLKDSLIVVRPLRPEDFDALFAVASDPLIWEQHPSHDRYELPVFRAFFKEALDSGGAFAIVDAKTGRIIGSSRFHAYGNFRREVEIGWTFLAREYWGGTYNRALKGLMLRHAFRFVDSVIFRVGPLNIRSRRALENIGAVYVGVRKEDTGKESAIYRMTAATFTSPAGFSGDVPSRERTA